MLLKNKVEIEEWLKKYNIKNYELIEDTEYGYVVNVNDNVNLSEFNLKKINKIEVKFNIINGNFNCSGSKLKSLIGSPNIVSGWFNCSFNELTSLKYSPNKINKWFDCSYNQLIELKDGPKVVNGDYHCNDNLIISTEGIPNHINRHLILANNKLEVLNFLPETINGEFYCKENNLNINGIKQLISIKLKSNYINLENNISLGELQKIYDFNKLKEIINVIIEKEKLDLLIKKNNAIIDKKTVNKI